MKKSKLNIFFICLTCFFVACQVACQKEITVKLPEHEPALCLNGTMNNTQQPYVYLSASKSKNDDTQYNSFPFEPIENAQVSLYENGNFLSNLNLATPNLYNAIYFDTTKTYLLKPNNSYKIEVQAPNFETVSFEGTLPNPVKIKGYDIQYNYVVNSDSGLNIHKIDIHLDDPANEQNYYLGHFFYRDTTLNRRIPIYMLENESSFINFSIYSQVYFNLNYQENITYHFFNDQLFDGQSSTLSFYVQGSLEDEFPEYFVLGTCSKDFYQYCEARDKNSFADEDIFTEPVSTPNNIKNGYGMLGMYSSDSILIQ